MRLTATHIFYGILWTMLAAQATTMNTSGYRMLTRNASEETTHILAANAAIVNDYEAFMSDFNDRQYMKPGYGRMLSVRRHVAAELRYLDSVTDFIITASGYSPRDTAPGQAENRRWRRNIFPEKAAALRLLNRIDTLNEFLIRNVSTRRRDSRVYFRRRLPSKWGDDDWAAQDRYRDEAAWILYRSSAAAAVAMLTGFKQKIVLSEKELLWELYAEWMPKYDPFDAYAGISIPDKYVVVPGEAVSGKIFIAAYNKRIALQTTCTAGRITGVDHGIAMWKGTAMGTGLHRISGEMRVNTDSAVSMLPWSFTYRSGPLYAGLQLDKMSCIYRGIQNPASISCAAGYDVQDMSLCIPGARVTATDTAGTYLIRVNSRAAKRLTAMIIYKGRQGRPDTIGGMTLTVKDLPMPLATIGHKTEGTVTAAELIRAGALAVASPDKDWQLSYTLLGYSFSYLNKGGSVLTESIKIAGADYAANTQVQDILKGASAGDRVFFSDIKAAAPDGGIVSPLPVHYLLR